MQTECSPSLFEFEAADGKKIGAGFDGGTITSDAGVLLPGRLDRGLGLICRLAACFTDRRVVEHEVETLAGQRVFALAPGYEELDRPWQVWSRIRIAIRNRDWGRSAGPSMEGFVPHAGETSA